MNSRKPKIWCYSHECISVHDRPNVGKSNKIVFESTKYPTFIRRKPDLTQAIEALFAPCPIFDGRWRYAIRVDIIGYGFYLAQTFPETSLSPRQLATSSVEVTTYQSSFGSNASHGTTWCGLMTVLRNQKYFKSRSFRVSFNPVESCDPL